MFFGEGLPGHSLVNPNQLRHFGLTVQDNTYDTKKEMSIQGINSNENDFYLPLLSKGVDIFFNTRTPTHLELDSCVNIHFTNKLEWHPSELVFPGGKTRRDYEHDTQNCAVTCSALRNTAYEPRIF